MTARALYGVVAEFEGIDPLIDAAREIKGTGATKLETYTPFASETLEELIPGEQRLIPVLIFVFGMIGLLGFFFLECWCAAINYPTNVGGRPYVSWPAFVPACFEVGLVWAVAAGFVAFFATNRLPKLYNPLFAVPGFDRASQDAFFICVMADDPTFDRERISTLLDRAGAVRVLDVMS